MFNLKCIKAKFNTFQHRKKIFLIPIGILVGKLIIKIKLGTWVLQFFFVQNI